MLAGVLVNSVTLSAFHVGMVTENAAIIALVRRQPDADRALGRAAARRALRRRQWLGLALGATGVVLVVAPRALEGAAAWGALQLGFVGVASLAGGTIYFRRFGRDVPLIPATACSSAPARS